MNMVYTANQVLKRTVEGVLHKNRSSEVTGTLRSKTAIPGDDTYRLEVLQGARVWGIVRS